MTCRCHGSKSYVTNGTVLVGQGQNPVKIYETREEDSNLEIER